jgi:hypothetical protein
VIDNRFVQREQGPANIFEKLNGALFVEGFHRWFLSVEQDYMDMENGSGFA